MGDLTANFSLDEFLVSATAVRYGIDNTPTPEALKRIKQFTAPGMQLVRDAVGRAIVMTNAYRNTRVNKLVGGVANSAHPKGYATDSRAAGLSAYSYACIVRDLMQPPKHDNQGKQIAPAGPLYGKIDQLILESGRGIVHISFDPTARGQVLTQKRGPGSPCVKGLIH